MPPDRYLLDTTAGAVPTDTDVQQLVEAESGHGTQGVFRRWLASDSDLTVLTSDATGVKISRDTGTTAPAQVVVDGTPAGGGLAGTYPDPTLAASTLDALIPPGTIWAYGGAAAPAGWLVCVGQVVGRGAYPKLWAAIGGSYGPFDAVNFTLPDFRGRVVLGASAGHPLGLSGGSETPAHTHPGPHQHDLNGHTHQTNLDHDHLTAHPTSTSIPVGVNGLALAGGVNLPTDVHTHRFDVPVLGAHYADSLTPSTPDTGSASPSHAASWTAAGALPPFQTATMIIRTG